MLKAYLKKIIVFLITFEAKLVLKKFHPRVIVITGSVGKTSTKDAIYAAIAPYAFVRKSEKSFNTEVGVPLTILGRPSGWTNPYAWFVNIVDGFLLLVAGKKYPQWLVLEVGADRPGDIKHIASWLSPDMVVITRFAPVPVHVEYFDSPEEVFAEKAEMVKALKPSGTLVLLHDDEKVRKLSELSPSKKVLTYGFSRGSLVRGSKNSIVYEGRGQHRRPTGMSFIFTHEGKSAEVVTKNSIGRQGLYAILAAAAAGITLEKDITELARALSAFEAPTGRMRILPGVKEMSIIDDTYNSSPVAVKEALDALAHLKIKGKKLAVLGDMLELGQFSVQEHKSIGAYALGKVDMLVAVGVRSRDTALGALEVGFDASNILQFDDSRQAGKAIETLIQPGDAVLIKGSQGMRMEYAVEEIMAHPEDKERLLVRQEDEWLAR